MVTQGQGTTWQSPSQSRSNVFNSIVLTNLSTAFWLTWKNWVCIMISVGLAGWVIVQFSSVPWPIWSLAGTWGIILHRSSSSLFCRRPWLAVLAWLTCPLFGVVHPAFLLPTVASITHPPRCAEGWFWRGRHEVWHARTMQVFISLQLTEEVPVDPRGSWSSYFPPSNWSCAPSRKNGK